MKYKRFEDLPVWKSAMELAERIYLLTDHRAFARLPELRDQVRRAGLSVSSNIAEGFERGTTNELIYFLYIARGSAGETRSQLIFTERLAASDSRLGESLRAVKIPKSQISNLKSEISSSEISNLKSEISDIQSEISSLKSLAESCSRQIRAWADNLQNTDIRGQRHLNEQSKQNYQSQKSADAFVEKLNAVRNGADVHQFFSSDAEVER